MKTKCLIISVLLTSLLFSCSMNSDDNKLNAPDKTVEASEEPVKTDVKPETPEPTKTPEVPETPAEIINATAPSVSANRILISPDGSAVTFTCNAESSDGSLSYQWYVSADGTEENKSAIEDATSDSYTTEAFTTKEIRYYFCTVTNTISDNGDTGTKTSSQTTAFYAAYTGLPVLYLNTGDTPTSEITRDSYVLGNFKLVSENYGTVDYSFTKIKNGIIKEGIKGRGNSSWGMPKKGYNIKFDTKQSLLGLPESKKYCIIANYSDKALLRNKFASVLGKDVFNNEWNPSFVNVDVVLNGEYLGNYTLCEKISIEKQRINIQDISEVTKDKNNDGITDLYDGGFILEIDARHDADFWFDTTKGVPFTLKDPDDVSVEIQDHIKGIVQNAEDILYGDDFTDSENGWRKYIDEDSVIDWYLVNEFAKNVDAPFWLSVYMIYSPSDGKLHLGPNWDFDLGFGNANYTNDGRTTSCEVPDGWYIKIAKIGTAENWISRMFEDSAFVANIKSRWNDKKTNLQNIVNSQLQTLASENTVSADFNFIKWPILGTYVWPNAAGYESRKSYQSEIDYMKNWCNARYSWLDWAINSL